MSAPEGFTLITGSKFQSASGVPLANGRVVCTPVNNSGQTVSSIAGPGGMILVSPVTFLIVDGAITTDTLGNAAQLADCLLNNPSKMGYNVEVIDASTNAHVQGPGYTCVQPTGSTWSFDNYVPIQPALVTVQSGPSGESAYQTWLGTGNTGTQEEFLASLVGPVGPATVVTENGADGNFIAEGNISGAQVAGEYIASENGNNLGSMVSAAGEGKVQLDPGTSIAYLAEFDVNSGTRTRTQAYPAGLYIKDRRPGFEGSFAYSQPPNNSPGAHVLLHANYPTSGQVNFNATNVYAESSFHAPGSMTIGGETNGKNFAEQTFVSQKGIHQNRYVLIQKNSEGDVAGQYTYLQGFFGSINPDDEGAVIAAGYITEGNNGNATQATISGIGTAADGTQYLTLSPGNNGFGSGRYLLLLKNASGADANIGTFTAQGQAFLTVPTESNIRLATSVTIAETLTGDQISAVWAFAPVAWSLAKGADVAQSVTVTLTLQGGANIATGLVPGIVSWSAQYRNERSLITAVQPVVNSGGTYTQQITMLVRQQPDGAAFAPWQPNTTYDGGDQYVAVVGGVNVAYTVNDTYTSGATFGATDTANASVLPNNTPCMFFQDAGGTASGLGQSVVKVLGLSGTGNGANSVAYPVLGATGPNTLIVSTNSTYGQNGISVLAELLPFVEAVSLSRSSSGLVTVSSAGGGQITPYTNMPISIVATDTSFNVANVTSGGNAYGQLTYQQSDTTAANTTGTLTVGAGRNLLKAYRGCEVIHTSNPAPASYPDQLGNYLGLEANNIPWVNGCVVESPSHYSLHVGVQKLACYSFVPIGNGLGTILDVGGGVTRAGNAFVAHTTKNGNPATDYLGSGGYFNAPPCWEIIGAWNTVMDMSQMPANFTIHQLPPFQGPASQTAQQIVTLYQGGTQNSYIRHQLDLLNDQLVTYFGGLSAIYDGRNNIFTMNAATINLNGVVGLGCPQYTAQASYLKNLQLSGVWGCDLMFGNGYGTPAPLAARTDYNTRVLLNGGNAALVGFIVEANPSGQTGNLAEFRNAGATGPAAGQCYIGPDGTLRLVSAGGHTFKVVCSDAGVLSTTELT